ncbi:bifunctional rhamnulose-1-phosphate aldolase/short-chain dehydrogenase [Phycisphaera mikurensis]|uniref:Putative rhamnulose-1-phosphate aldolase/alcohol dehydrogenase n=1 Tax=Phycisphaera mikurensis (strain NBRC 102666 / KCTC 22515 / FYK2301M01) TaxID=1142394 RepID=I0IIK3_PHYMF|nr:bifunctional rhamnulose-1-phosphate aldolase/short-chain dehydrogenase [Phycisphaera mikurensis]MBB6442754.1 rhamnulose-1-phosphate aldolase/alcohol dehydrogenase [Phycisphaera mikurensis]BAM05091.1 putative rhamnulose-1-phosphate aldolase/alcohol dehydrogenase [Phycisphaera mikurensis NBRC 102666]
MPDPAALKNSPHVAYLWNDAEAPSDPVDALVYRSNILGADQRITNTGGGNTSSKVKQKDPLTGEEVDVLWVKGSGGDLRTSKRENFASLSMASLEQLKASYEARSDTGLKTPAEDEQVANYRHCTFDLNPRASSIDTPLHAFLPARHVDHMHPNAVIAVAASKNNQELTQTIWGGRLGWVPWMRPGFELGLLMHEEQKKNPRLEGLLMAAHGLINWHDDARACYDLSLDLIDTAARYIADHDKHEQTFGGAKYRTPGLDEREALLVQVLPWLRGRVSQQQRFIGTVDDRESVLQFVNSHDAARLAELGTSCPDHFLRTKIKPLYVDWDPASGDVDVLKQRLDEGLERYRADYRSYYEACKKPDSPAMRDPNPTVVLIPGLGLIAWGKNKSESRVTAEFYCCAVEVMRGAEAIDAYVGLPQQEAFDIEYWALEEAKLQRMPAEKPLARRVVVVVGAGSGIGRAVAEKLAAQGGHIVSADMKLEAAQETADDLTAAYGQGIGVAGTGVSGCGPATAAAANITDTVSLAGLIKHAVLAYGGIDHLVVTAGVFVPQDPATGQVTPQQWQLTFDVNVRGSYNAVWEMKPVFDAQGLEGSVVLTTSVNAVVAKKGSVAYDCSKAAADHLVRELAVEMSPTVRVNAIAPATVVAGSTMFPRQRVLASLAKYGIEHDAENGKTEDLRNRLAQFYAERTLTHNPIRPEDQAEAAWFLLSDASSRTTGQIIHVDGGLADAFLR